MNQDYENAEKAIGDEVNMILPVKLVSRKLVEDHNGLRIVSEVYETQSSGKTGRWGRSVRTGFRLKASTIKAKGGRV